MKMKDLQCNNTNNSYKQNVIKENTYKKDPVKHGPTYKSTKTTILICDINNQETVMEYYLEKTHERGSWGAGNIPFLDLGASWDENVLIL